MKLIHVLVLSLLLLSCSRRVQTIRPGDQAIDFSLQSVSDSTFTLGKYKGDKILLHFWADWCSQCRAEFPKLQQAYESRPNKNIEIIALNVGQTKEHVRSFVAHYNLQFPMLLDPDMAISQKYGISGLPATVLINRDFTIQKIHLGWLDESIILEMTESMK